MSVLAGNRKALIAVFFLCSAALLASSGIATAQVGTDPNGTNATNASGNAPLGDLSPRNGSIANGSVNASANSTGISANASLSNGSANASGTNATNGTASGGGGGSGKCGVANPGGCIPTIQGMIESGIQYVVSGVTENLQGIVQSFSDLMVGLPAPGEGWDVSTWTNPDNGWWPGIYQAYAIFSGISISLLGLAFLYAYETTDPYTRRKRLRRLALHAVMIIFGSVIIIPASLHFFDTLAQAVAPSADEFFASAGNISRLGVGALIGGGLLVTQSTLILIGIGVLLAIYVSIHLLAAFWPVFWLSRLAPISSIEWVGNAGIGAFYALCVMRFLQSAFLRVLFELPMDPVAAGAGSAIAALLMTIIGLYLAFVTIPKTFAKKAIPGVQMLSSNSPSSEDIREGYQESRERIGDVKGRFERVRGSGSNNTTPAHKRRIGQMQQSTGSRNDASGGGGSVAGSGSESASASGSASSGTNAGEWDNSRYNVRQRANRGD